MTTQHPSDETLNEYLDGVLDAPARARVDAHLAGCLQCAARLEAVRALFAELEALPDEPLARDLSAGVLAHLRQPEHALSSLPALRWVVAMQALAALMLLAVAAPFALASLPVAEMALLGRPLLDSVTELLAGLAAQAQSLGAALAAWSEQSVAGARALAAPLAETSTALLGAGLAVVFVLWVLGNGLLLRQTFSTRSR